MSFTLRGHHTLDLALFSSMHAATPPNDHDLDDDDGAHLSPLCFGMATLQSINDNNASCADIGEDKYL